ncbi:phage tail tube protein [Streptomyces cinereoruber]|uniref:phage tail tube protein n=1 Tax=Streptomyces cinereoruber TaxID=67260 RepID=UPI003642974F
MPRFSRRGKTKILFATTLASTAYIPTRSELSGATKLTKSIAAVDGFALENQPIDTPDLESTFTSKIEGEDQAADSTLTFYEDRTDDTLETALAKGTTGFIIILRKGDIPGSNSMDVYPVTVASKSSTITVDNESAKWMAKFVITDTPALDVAVPAAGADEIQTVTITGSPTGGTFTLTLSGQTTSNIVYNATASAVQSALEALSNVNPGDVVCAGGALPGTPVTVTFGGQYDGTDVPEMTASGAGLTGGSSPTVTVTTSTPGG